MEEAAQLTPDRTASVLSVEGWCPGVLISEYSSSRGKVPNPGDFFFEYFRRDYGAPQEMKKRKYFHRSEQ
jgi:hypothetical protein